MQNLISEGTQDGHGAVRVGSSVFVVDTRHGNIVEPEFPSLENGALPVKKTGYVTMSKHHAGFKQANHINNVAIHSHFLIYNFHGTGHKSSTRLSALSKEMEEEDF